MSYRQTALLFDSAFHSAIARAPLVLVDVGARGNLPQPWLSLDRTSSAALKVVGFEPDPEECQRLNDADGTNRRFFPYALWDRETMVPLNLAINPATSSVHAPNFAFIEQFQPRHWQPRRTARKLEVRARPLDVILAEAQIEPDFLKLDTQGSEFEVLQGSTDALGQHIFGVLAETWIAEVHLGQHLSHDVMRLMADNAFNRIEAHHAVE